MKQLAEAARCTVKIFWRKEKSRLIFTWNILDSLDDEVRHVTFLLQINGGPNRRNAEHFDAVWHFNVTRRAVRDSPADCFWPRCEASRKGFLCSKKVTWAAAKVSSVSYADHIGLRPMWHYPLCSSLNSAQLRCVSWGMRLWPRISVVIGFEITSKPIEICALKFSRFSKSLPQVTQIRVLFFRFFEKILCAVSRARNFRSVSKSVLSLLICAAGCSVFCSSFLLRGSAHLPLHKSWFFIFAAE